MFGGRQPAPATAAPTPVVETAPRTPAPAATPEPPAVIVDESAIGPPAASSTGPRLVRPAGALAKTRVAILLPLSGREAALGVGLLDAAQLAVFEAADESFELMPIDSGDTPQAASAAAEQAIAGGATLILGPVFATSTSAVAPLARAAGLNVISFSNDRSIAGANVFVMGLLPAPQIERTVLFAAQKGVSRFAIFAPDTEYGRLIAAALQSGAARAGGAVVQVRHYDPQTADFSAEVRRFADYDRRRARAQAQQRQAGTPAPRRPDGLEGLEDLPFQALVVPEFGERLRSLAPLLPFYGIDQAKVKLIGTSQWDDPALVTEPSLFGAWFAAPASIERNAFVQRYERAFGRRPHRLASLAYDATALAAVLARQTESKSDFSAAALQQPAGFQGVDGIFRFGRDGAAERGLAVFEIVQRGQRVIDPAPENFAVPIN